MWRKQKLKWGSLTKMLFELSRSKNWQRSSRVGLGWTWCIRGLQKLKRIWLKVWATSLAKSMVTITSSRYNNRSRISKYSSRMRRVNIMMRKKKRKTKKWLKLSRKVWSSQKKCRKNRRPNCSQSHSTMWFLKRGRLKKSFPSCLRFEWNAWRVVEEWRWLISREKKRLIVKITFTTKYSNRSRRNH